jgi:PAS domain S-box-containing protein
MFVIESEISKRKLAEEELIRLSNAVRMSTDSIVISDLEAKIIDVNEATLKMYGTDDKGDLVGKNSFDLIAPEDREKAFAGLEETLARGYTEGREYHIIIKDGSRIPVEMSAALMKDADGNPIGFVSINRDITERKRAGEALRASESKYRTLVENIPQKIFVKDRNSVYVSANENYARDLGITPEAIAGKVDYDFFPKELADKYRGDDQRIMEAGTTEDIEEKYIQEGREVWVQTIKTPIRNEQGDVVGILGIFWDITERKRAGEELRRLKEFNEGIVQSMAEGIAVEDAEGHFTFANPAAAAMLGYAPEELLGQHWTAITPPDQYSIVRAIDERRMRGEADRYELELVRKDGTRISVLVSGSPRFEEGRFAGTLAVFTDITERKRVERLLRALNQAALAMERALTPEEIFTTVAEELKKLGFSCAVLLTDESQKKLFPKYFSYETGAIKAAEKLVGLKAEGLSIPVETVDVYRKIVRERKPILVEDSEEVVRQLLPGPAKRLARQIARMLKVAKSIDVPLIVEDKVIGLFLVQSDNLTEDDIPAISAFTHQMAAAWRKATLLQDLERSLAEVERAQEELRHSYAQLRRTFEGTIHVLVSAIEMRDPYTAGHQRRVTQLVCAIAKEMGLSDERIEGLRMAGLIHDIGKISVPAEVLSKPGPLSDLEYGLIQAHTQVGYDVLNGTIEFPWPVAQIVLQHHERMDGSGYPQGLSGEEILLEARILAVADVVEAMASHRPYRSALGIEKALEEISQNRGILYDPEVVDACLKLFTEKGFRFEDERSTSDYHLLVDK